MTFILATANPGKIKEMREILSGPGYEIKTRKELGIDMDIPETGSDFIENARAKADAICAVSGLPAIADDSGLIVAALDGAPGLYSSTFGGGGLSDSARCMYLLEKMKNMEQRAAKFVSSIVCVFPDGDVLAAEGECRGEIARAPRGSCGFGYDPVFIVEGTNRTMAELSPEEKNAVSHRGKALKEFTALLAVQNM